MKQFPALQTERLVLRQFELSDAKDVQCLAGDRNIADTTLNVPHPYKDGMAEQWISTHKPKFEAGELTTFAITLRDNGTLIGAIHLRIVPRFDRTELGYWIGKIYWNNGYCTEACRAVLEYGFTVINLNRINASHLKRHPASERVIQKIGMIYEGCAREHVKKWDVFDDLELYAILKVEWQKYTEQGHAH